MCLCENETLIQIPQLFTLILHRRADVCDRLLFFSVVGNAKYGILNMSWTTGKTHMRGASGAPENVDPQLNLVDSSRYVPRAEHDSSEGVAWRRRARLRLYIIHVRCVFGRHIRVQ